ncbi:hypothetical protein [Anderseniella sp. Alg231-50]|uniref:hypothetical protein n=1 Tax=Anderseniella sp. Alg231-50 TaxID=1922226 RepID=UPI00307CAFC9
MKFVPEEISAEIAFHELAYNAMCDALIAASEKGTAIFPVVQAHGSDAFGTPQCNSIIILFDQNCGRTGVAVEAGQLNAYLTAAADAVAADVLAHPDASPFAISRTSPESFANSNIPLQRRNYPQSAMCLLAVLKGVQHKTTLQIRQFRIAGTGPVRGTSGS